MRTRPLLLPAALACVLALSACDGLRGDDCTRVSGTVLDSLSGDPLPGLYVGLQQTFLPDAVDSTDAQGGFDLNTCRGGRMSLFVNISVFGGSLKYLYSHDSYEEIVSPGTYRRTIRLGRTDYTGP